MYLYLCLLTVLYWPSDDITDFMNFIIGTTTKIMVDARPAAETSHVCWNQSQPNGSETDDSQKQLFLPCWCKFLDNLYISGKETVLYSVIFMHSWKILKHFFFFSPQATESDFWVSIMIWIGW